MRKPMILTVLLATASCNRGDAGPPFDLWDMHAGMPLAALDSISLHDQQQRFACADAPSKFRRCSVRTKGVPGLVDVVVDSTGRAVRIAFRPDSTGLGGLRITAGGLIHETELLREQWSDIGSAEVQGTEIDGAWRERWVAGDGRWSAVISWEGAPYPAEVAVNDEEAVRAWTLVQERAQADSLVRATSAPVELAPRHSDPDVLLDLVKVELRRLVDTQQLAHLRVGHYATAIRQVLFVPRPRIQVEIGGADHQGWWARGHHESLPERSCVVWGGRPPSPPADRGNVEGEPVCN